MDSKVWGPWAWRWLQGWASRYDPSRGMAGPMDALIKTSIDVLPCTYCRSSCRAFVHGDGPTKARALDSRDALEAWWYGLHCQVNGKLHRPERKCPSLAKVRSTYRGLSTEATREAFWHLAFITSGNYGGDEGIGTPTDSLAYASWWRAVGIAAASGLDGRLGRAILGCLEETETWPRTREGMVEWTWGAYRLSGGRAPRSRVGVLIERARVPPRRHP